MNNLTIQKSGKDSKENKHSISEETVSTSPSEKPQIDFSGDILSVESLITNLEAAHKLRPRNEVYGILIQLYQVKKELKNL